MTLRKAPYRRAMRERAKARAKQLARRWDIAWYRLMHQHTPCSCEMCTSHKLEPTRQELQADITFKEGLLQ